MHKDNYIDWTLDGEDWRDVVGYERFYQVSNLGRVRSKHRIATFPHQQDASGMRTRIWRARILKQKRSKHPLSFAAYRLVTLQQMGRKPKCVGVHRLVVAAFIGTIPKGLCCNHKNGDGEDNRVENLEVVTYSQNTMHAIYTLNRSGIGSYMKTKMNRRGSHNSQSKIVEDDVKTIREMLANGVTGVEIARQFDVSPNVVSRIRCGHRWTHV